MAGSVMCELTIIKPAVVARAKFKATMMKISWGAFKEDNGMRWWTTTEDVSRPCDQRKCRQHEVFVDV
jgi:hypothetical protein